MGADLTEIRREQILEAATMVFADQGFNEARMDDIVHASGLSKGAVYWYFKSKEEIVFTILERFLSRELHQLEEIVEEQRPARDRLSEIMGAFAREVEEMQSIMPIAYEFYALATRHNKVRMSFRTFFKRYQDLFEGLLTQGIQKKEFIAVDPKEVAISILGVLEGLTLLWTLAILDRKKYQLENLFESSVGLILDGISPS
jgi:AcrR family transcriptional regulator